MAKKKPPKVEKVSLFLFSEDVATLRELAIEDFTSWSAKARVLLHDAILRLQRRKPEVH